MKITVWNEFAHEKSDPAVKELCKHFFPGRIEAAADRKTGTLAVKHIWYEDGVRRTKKLASAVDGAVRRLAKLNGCSQIAFPE